MRHASNLTNEELFRLTGTLPKERIEELLDKSKVDVKAALDYISESSRYFPDEGFLSDLSNKIRNIVDDMRKSENKTRLENILAYIDDYEMQIFYESEEGMDLLHKAVKSLKGE